MSNRPAGPCTHPGCPAVSVHKGRCSAHQRPAWSGSGRGRGTSGWDWQRTVKRILERDGYVCHLCGLPIAEGEGTADHVISLARGGHDGDSNLASAHRSCNQSKAATTDRARGGAG